MGSSEKRGTAQAGESGVYWIIEVRQGVTPSRRYPQDRIGGTRSVRSG